MYSKHWSIYKTQENKTANVYKSVLLQHMLATQKGKNSNHHLKTVLSEMVLNNKIKWVTCKHKSNTHSTEWLF